jgi:hypothetical protein
MVERLRKHFGADAGIEVEQEQQSAQRHRVLHDRQKFAQALGESANRQWDRGHVVVEQGDVAMEFVRVEYDYSSGADFRGVAFDRVLVQGNDCVELITMRANFVLGNSHSKPYVPAANNRLVAIVGVEVEAQAGAGLGQRIAALVHSVACSPSYSYGYFFHAVALQGESNVPARPPRPAILGGVPRSGKIKTVREK